MADMNEVATLLHIVEKTVGQTAFANIHRHAIEALRTINAEHAPQPAPVEEPAEEDSGRRV